MVKFLHNFNFTPYCSFSLHVPHFVFIIDFQCYCLIKFLIYSNMYSSIGTMTNLLSYDIIINTSIGWEYYFLFLSILCVINLVLWFLRLFCLNLQVSFLKLRFCLNFSFNWYVFLFINITILILSVTFLQFRLKLSMELNSSFHWLDCFTLTFLLSIFSW